MYKILIHIDTQSGDKWFYYQENGKDYVTNSLQEIKDTVLTLIDVYGEDYIKIVKQMSGQDMDNADVYIYDSTDNYEELNNRPYINGVEIVGQLTLEDLGIQPMGNYATEEYVDDAVANIDIPEVDLSNYYTKEEIDTNLGNVIIVPIITYSSSGDKLQENIDAIQRILPLIKEKDVILRVIEKNDTNYEGMHQRLYFLSPAEYNKITDITTYTGSLTWHSEMEHTIKTTLENTFYDTKTVTNLRVNIENGVVISLDGTQGGSSSNQYSTELAILGKYNTKTYTPTGDYHPATKKYVDDNIPPTIVYKAFAPNDHTIYLTNGVNIASIDEVKTQLNNFIKDCIKDGNYNKILHLGIGKYNGRYQSYLFTEYEEGIQSYGSDPYVERRYFGCSVNYAGNNPKGQRRYLCTWDLIINVDDTLDEPVKKAILYVTSYGILEPNNTVAYTPTSDYNPATKKYVDDAVANIDVPDVDLSDYYNKTEVDDKLLTVDVNVEGLDIYSDEERVIGRWVDGRPLYQKYIYIGELTNGITDTHLDDYGIKAHEVRFHQVYKMGPDGILCLISPQFMSMAGQVIARVLLYQEDSGVNVLRVATGEGMDVEGHTAYAIVTYTKPDDEILLPTSDYYPATKKYVDDAIAGVSGGSGGEVDLTNYYTKAEVDALLQALRDEFVSANNSINDKLETIIYGGE